MVVGANDIAKAANVGMAEQGHNGGFAGGANFLGLVGAFLIGTGLMAVVC